MIVPSAFWRPFEAFSRQRRNEKPYDSGYTLMCLTVEGDSADRRDKVEPHQRRKQENPESFVPILNNLGGDAFV